jgi:hypothetical protein
MRHPVMLRLAADMADACSLASAGGGRAQVEVSAEQHQQATAGDASSPLRHLDRSICAVEVSEAVFLPGQLPKLHSDSGAGGFVAGVPAILRVAPPVWAAAALPVLVLAIISGMTTWSTGLVKKVLEGGKGWLWNLADSRSAPQQAETDSSSAQAGSGHRDKRGGSKQKNNKYAHGSSRKR